MRKRWLLLLSALLCLCGMLTAQHNVAEDNDWSEFLAKRTLYIEKLSKSVVAAVNRTDTGYPIFHGCLDWHSSVHGYWALLRASKYVTPGKKKQYIEFVKNSFAASGVAQEKTFLSKRANFEMPYGRAWFLRLEMEYEAVTEITSLRPMADEIATSLMGYYKLSPPFVYIGEYANAEWAFRHLHDYAEFSKNTEIAEFVASQAKTIFHVTERKMSFAHDSKKYPEFFSRFGNYMHLCEVTADADLFKQILSKYQPDTTSLLPIESFKNFHHLGMNFSRAWGLWSLYRRTNDLTYRKAYLTNVMMGMQEHESYQNDYNSYGHWVPQFGIYALTYSAEVVSEKK